MSGDALTPEERARAFVGCPDGVACADVICVQRQVTLAEAIRAAVAAEREACIETVERLTLDLIGDDSVAIALRRARSSQSEGGR